MPRQIPPIPTTEYYAYRPKVGDGLSIEVTVPAGTPQIEPGQLCYFDGILGFAMPKSGAALPSDSVNDQKLILNIEQAQYETDQINTSEAFNTRGPIYWDNANKRLTTTAAGNKFAGILTRAKDQNNVIEFLLAPQVPITGA